jgi:integrase
MMKSNKSNTKNVTKSPVITLAQYADQWLENHEDEWKPNTYDGYRRDVDSYIKPRLGDRDIRSITPQDIKEFYANLAQGGMVRRPKGLSYGSVKQVHTTLCRIFHAAIDEDELMKYAPTDHAKPKRDEKSILETAKKMNSRLASFFQSDTDETEADAYTPEEVRNLLTWLHDQHHHLELLANIALATGMRRGEILALSWMQVHETGAGMGELAIIRNLTSTSAGKNISLPKSQAGLRTVYLPQPVMELLEARKAEQVATGTYKPDGLVFPGLAGNPQEPDTVSKQWQRMMAKYPYRRKLGLHRCRHTHASLRKQLAGQGASQEGMKRVQEDLGHASAAMTQHYTHEYEETAMKDANALGSMLFGKKEDDNH